MPSHTHFSKSNRFSGWVEHVVLFTINFTHSSDLSPALRFPTLAPTLWDKICQLAATRAKRLQCVYVCVVAAVYLWLPVALTGS